MLFSCDIGRVRKKERDREEDRQLYAINYTTTLTEVVVVHIPKKREFPSSKDLASIYVYLLAICPTKTYYTR